MDLGGLYELLLCLHRDLIDEPGEWLIKFPRIGEAGENPGCLERERESRRDSILFAV